MKNNLIGDVEDRLVRYLSETYPGRVHDKHICDAEELVFPSDIGLFQDTGFQGYHPAGVHIYQPKKKPKGKELTPEEKAENTIISSIRILIEHIIAGVKRCRIVKDVFRTYGSPIFKAVRKKRSKASYTPLRRSPKSPKCAVGEDAEQSHVDTSDAAPQ